MRRAQASPAPSRRSAPTSSPQTDSGSRRAAARRVLDALEQTHPEATCALHYRNPFELVLATILSAQCTDERVNQVTPALFQRFPSAPALAAADLSEVEELVRSTGFFRAKAKSILTCSAALVARHAGEVPARMEDLVRLPGVGRKTANVVLGHAFLAAEGLAVDRHVLRVSNRLGLADSNDPEEVEAQLMALLPRERWTRTSDLLIFHGRKICAAQRPACGECPVRGACAWPPRTPAARRKPSQR